MCKIIIIKPWNQLQSVEKRKNAEVKRRVGSPVYLDMDHGTRI